MGILKDIFGGPSPDAVAAVETAGGDGGSPSATSAPVETQAAGQVNGGAEPGGRQIGDAVDRIAAQHGASAAAVATPSPEPPKNKGGRPIKHGRFSRAAGSDGKHPAPGLGPEEVAPPEVESDVPIRFGMPADLLQEFVTEGLTELSDARKASLLAKAKAGGLSESVVGPLVETAGLKPSRVELLAKVTPHALREHGIDPEVSPTACLATALLIWAVQGMRTAKQIDRMIATNRPGEASTPPPGANAVKLG